MLKSLFSYSLLLLLLYLVLVFFSFQGSLSFGIGLGDIFYYILLWVTILLFAFIVYRLRRDISGLLIFNVFFTGVAVWFILSATVWRGFEYPWNGELFYPSKETKRRYAEKKRKNIRERDSLKKVIHFRPDFAEAYARVGNLNDLLGDDNEVEKYYIKAIELGDEGQRFPLARFYERNGKRSKAILQYEAILKKDSTNEMAKRYLRFLKNK